jgi:hypothetical protein
MNSSDSWNATKKLISHCNALGADQMVDTKRFFGELIVMFYFSLEIFLESLFNCRSIIIL